MARESTNDFVQLAERLARDAATISLEKFGHTRIETKLDQSVVTEADREIEKVILRAISATYPDHARCAEESASHRDHSRKESRFCWVIDPLDGTRNYAAGIPCFSTSIAVLDQGQPVAAVIYEHNVDQMFVARAGEGTVLNGQPVKVSDTPPNNELLVGVPSSKDALTRCMIRAWAVERGIVCRNFGSTAFQLGLVSSGALTATFCKRSKIWDVAAGALLVIEAGGAYTDPFGRPALPYDLAADPQDDLPCLAAAPRAHAQLVRSVKAATRSEIE